MNTPIEFHVSNWVFDDDESCLVLEGAALPGAGIEPGMKLTVALSHSLSLELPIMRVQVLACPPDHALASVWIHAEDEQVGAILRWLDIKDELALVWNAGDTVDASRHFAYGERQSEGVLDLRPFREGERRH